MRTRFFLLVCCLFALMTVGCHAASNAAIVIPDNATPVEQSAARELADGLLHISGQTVPVVTESDARSRHKGSFLFHIGATKAAAKLNKAEWSDDEILIKPVKGGMVLTGDPTRGPLYAVITLLEDGYGVRWWTSTETDWPSRKILPVPDISVSYIPPLKYREASCLDAYDADFRLRLKGNFASRIRCPVRVLVGFADDACVPCAVFATYNRMTAPDRAIVCGVGMGHDATKRPDLLAPLVAWRRAP